MGDPKLFDNDFESKWCPGCGNFPILRAMKQAFADLGKGPEDLLIVSGIGQAGKTPHFMNVNTFHGLHGRALPAATGAKLANHGLTVVVSTGDGDCYGEGGNHFLHAVRRNMDLTVLAHHNKVYGLTKGQAAPTAEVGFVTKQQKDGVISEMFNPLSIALQLGCGFVARGYSGNIAHLAGLIAEGMQYKGFALIDILQTCPSFNRVNTPNWYKERVYDLAETDYDPSDFPAAVEKVREWGDKIPIGVLFRTETRPFTARIKTLADGPLIDREYDAAAVNDLLEKVFA